jgi:hypothetical protein
MCSCTPPVLLCSCILSASRYGLVSDINLIRDEETGKSKGYAFLKYYNQKSTVLCSALLLYCALLLCSAALLCSSPLLGSSASLLLLCSAPLLCSAAFALLLSSALLRCSSLTTVMTVFE